MTSVQFDPPGKGTWEMDNTHVQRPLAGMVQEVFAPALENGMRTCCERYGMLLETLVVRFVHGFPYVQPRPVGAPEGASGTPPKFLFKLLTWLHPALRRRLATANEIFERKPWRKELEDWDARVKARSIAAHQRFEAVDVTAFDDVGLIEHLKVLLEHVLGMATQDHSYNLTFMIPVGDYLAHGVRWGLEGTELMSLLRGHSDISCGDYDEKRRLVAALREDTEARAVLESSQDPESIVNQLAERDGEVGDAMQAYLLIVGNAVAIGIALHYPSFREQPKLMVETLRRSLAEAPKQPNGVAKAEKHARDRVPAEHRAEFDDLLGEARLVCRLRDERHLYGVLPSTGIARRAILEAGRRLEHSGRLSAADLAFHAFSEELFGLLRGEAIPESAELEARQRLWESLDGSKVPLLLGPESAPPPADWLPGGARRMAEALGAYMGNAADPKQAAAETLEGLGVSKGSYEGTARICEHATDLDRIEAGDILVAKTTTPAINIVLPLLGAIVTDRGGALCHAAIVPREFGIPGVVGTGSATRLIADGMRIRVDGDAGRVEIL